jgi:hypothetical protein
VFAGAALRLTKGREKLMATFVFAQSVVGMRQQSSDYKWWLALRGPLTSKQPRV